LTIIIEMACTITELVTFKLQSFVLSLYLVYAGRWAPSAPTFVATKMTARNQKSLIRWVVVDEFVGIFGISFLLKMGHINPACKANQTD
jgi:hypothetical protein